MSGVRRDSSIPLATAPSRPASWEMFKRLPAGFLVVESGAGLAWAIWGCSCVGGEMAEPHTFITADWPTSVATAMGSMVACCGVEAPAAVTASAAGASADALGVLRYLLLWNLLLWNNRLLGHLGLPQLEHHVVGLSIELLLEFFDLLRHSTQPGTLHGMTHSARPARRPPDRAAQRQLAAAVRVPAAGPPPDLGYAGAQGGGGCLKRAASLAQPPLRRSPHRLHLPQGRDLDRPRLWLWEL